MTLWTNVVAMAMALAVVGLVTTERREGVATNARVAANPEADDGVPTFQAFTVVAPKLTGRMLQLTTMLLRVPVLGDLAVAQIKRDNDFASVTRLANRLAGDYEPVSRPYVVPTPEERAQHEQWAKTQTLVPVDASPTSNAKVPFMYDTAAVFTQAYTSKRFTPVQAVARVLDDIESLNPSLGHTVSQLLRQDAMRAAAASATRYAAGNPLGPLDGVPIVIKSELRVANASQTLGTSFHHKIAHGGHASVDDDPVARLRAAGCIVVGVAPMHELGVGVTGNNPSERTALNPHNTLHYSGGSSSGSAVSVAANLVPLAVGTDGGGSIRVPAGLCGVWGLKPTYDRVGRRPVLSVVGIGPIGASVRDVALAYVAMSGASSPPLVRVGGGKRPPVTGAAHPSSFQPPAHLHGVFAGEPASRVKGLRVGYLPSYAATASVDVLREHNDTLKRLQAAGAELVNLEPIPYLHVVMRAHVVLIYSEMAAMADKWWASHASELNPESLGALILGAAFTSRELLHAQKIRAWMMDVFRSHVFAQCDVVLLPGAGVASPRIPAGGLDGFGESNLEQVQQIMRFMFLANFVGLPSGAAPTNFDANGLPLGVQVMSSHWNEHVILRVMSFLEHDAVRVRGVWPRRPQVAASTGSGAAARFGLASGA